LTNIHGTAAGVVLCLTRALLPADHEVYLSKTIVYEKYFSEKKNAENEKNLTPSFKIFYI
jgi:hypothetical protein